MSQITDESLREAITQRLQATHVEVTDMSGALPWLSGSSTPPCPSAEPVKLAPKLQIRKSK